MTTGSFREVMRKRRKRRQDATALAPLIAAPSSMASSFKLPANARLWVAFDHIETARLVLDINAREIGVPALAANQRHPIGWFERGATITMKVGTPANMYLYADTGAGKLELIGDTTP